MSGNQTSLSKLPGSCLCFQRTRQYASIDSKKRVGLRLPTQARSLTLQRPSLGQHRPGFIDRRGLSQGHNRRSVETTQIRSQDPAEIPQYTFSVKPKEVKTSRRSQIRQSLRAWSEQHERIKLQDEPSILPSEGKVTRLPNALFLGPEQNIDDAQEKEVDETPVYDNEIDNHFLYRGGQVLSPGTLISHKSPLVRRQDVVYLGDIGTQSLIVLQSGKWAAEKLSQKRVAVSSYRHYPIQDFLTAQEIDLLRECMPKQDVTRSLDAGTVPHPIDVAGTVPEHVFAPILAKFQALDRERERFLRDNREQLRQMYDNLAFDDQWRTVTIKALPELILDMRFDDLTDVGKKTLVWYASTFHPLFVAVQTAEAMTFLIGPKSLNEDITSVQEWARSYQEAAAQAALGKNVSDLLAHNPLASFIDKARRIIMKSRKIRSPTNMGVLGPTLGTNDSRAPQKVSSEEELTLEDQKIIRYLWDIAIRRPLSRLPRAYGSLIVRAIGAYPNMELDHKTFRMLLQEMGCINPWTIVEDFNLPLFGTKSSWASDQLWLAAVDSVAQKEINGEKVTTFKDSMADMRRDWANMEAICIDSTTATNIEDSISLEPAIEVDGGYWLHTHFAHPSAHLDVDHPVVQAARKRGTSYYSHFEGEKVQQLVPLEVIRQFTLQKNSPVLTVSTLLGTDGTVHDIKVSSGTLRNVIRLDRDAVYELLEPKVEADEAILVVGSTSGVPELLSGSNRPTGESSERNLKSASKFLPQLQLVKNLLTARRLRRKQEVKSPARFHRLGITVSAKIALPEGYKIDRELDSYHWKGDPTIVLRGNRRINTSGTIDEYRSDDFVAQFVRLAAESLGKWMSDRNIPGIFLGNDSPTAFSIAQLNDMLGRTEARAPVFTRTTFPRPLFGQNMKQYTSCTSPLRKFSDMITQFQVDSYLRAEARGLVDPNAPITDDSILAFSRADIEDYLAVDVSAGDSLDDFHRENTQLWLFQALFRAFHFQEAVLPEIMEVMVQTPARRNAHGQIEPTVGYLIPWGAKISLETSVEGYENTARVGDFLPVSLVSVDPGLRVVVARAVGPATVEQQIFDPIKCCSPANSRSTMSTEAQPTT